MGFVVELRDEFGAVERRVLEPLRFSLASMVAEATAGRLLSYIDPYGDTAFNRLQMRDFLIEWNAIAATPEFADHLGFAEEVRAMAIQCQSEVHLYLWFIGD